jgi:hypothetical protein
MPQDGHTHDSALAPKTCRRTLPPPSSILATRQHERFTAAGRLTRNGVPAPAIRCASASETALGCITKELT